MLLSALAVLPPYECIDCVVAAMMLWVTQGKSRTGGGAEGLVSCPRHGGFREAKYAVPTVGERNRE